MYFTNLDGSVILCVHLVSSIKIPPFWMDQKSITNRLPDGKSRGILGFGMTRFADLPRSKVDLSIFSCEFLEIGSETEKFTSWVVFHQPI